MEDSVEVGAELVHAIPGRTRIRVRGGRLASEVAAQLSQRLLREPGVEAVDLNPRTGSVVCNHEPTLEAPRIVGLVVELVRDIIPPADPPAERGPSRLAREVARFFRHVDQQVTRATGNHLDLGTAATLSFVGAGALEVALTKQLPIPPWFNLAWWGFRTFMTLEGDAIKHINTEGVAGARADEGSR